MTLEISSLTNLGVKYKLAGDIDEGHEKWWQIKGKCNAIIANVGTLKYELATFAWCA